MLLSLINKVIRPVGLQLAPANDVYIRLDGIFSNTEDYALFSYTKTDGSFDYDRYKQVQEDGNKNKLNNVWVLEDNIEFLSQYLKDKVSALNSGLCHGTRRGKEQEWFKKYIADDANIIGTEISETATEFPDTIQWDFHEVKEEWIDAIDFIYSNSFDHSYAPEKCLDAWMSCIRPGGLCVLEHTNLHEADSSRELDPFGANLLQMPTLIAKWGKGKYGVREILQAPAKSGAVKYIAMIVIEKYL